MPRFTPDFLDELKARLRPSDVIGRYVKLKKQGREWAGLSPFTQEKTPSFFVNDQKGFFHCFSSGKHGDIISFLMETQGLAFHEAVARLAEEAGLELPAEETGDAERARKKKGLVEACAAAADFFAAMLRRADGRAAADYLAGRGVTRDQIETFRLGYAPEARTALKDHLINKGYTEEILIEAGLLIKPEDGGPSYDRFRGRVMFPILGVNDAVIAFGGRALDKSARAKYLNSPETPLFHKGHVLYNFNGARRAAAETGAPLIVCEGYMDVIALWGAGFRQAVAPLGTALTDRQLALLWRVSDEPVLCLDGDRAGIAAAHRAIDHALPLLKPGKSLSFVYLPSGRDPDDLIREEGPGAFEKALSGAAPMADVLWRRELEAQPLDRPERRAALKARLRALARSIADPDVRAAYGADFARRLDELFAAPRADKEPGRTGAYGSPRGSGDRRTQADRGGGKAGWRGWSERARASPALKRRGAPSSFYREAALVLAAINHPALVERREADFLGLSFQNQALNDLLGEVLSAILTDPTLDSAGLKRHLLSTKAADILERVLSDDTLNRQTFLRPTAEIDEVEWGWSDALRLHLFAVEAERDLAQTASQLFSLGDEAWKAAAASGSQLAHAADEENRQAGDVQEEAKRLRDALERASATVRSKSRR